MKMLLKLAGTLAVGGTFWALAFGCAVADDVLRKARRAKAWGSLPIE